MKDLSNGSILNAQRLVERVLGCSVDSGAGLNGEPQWDSLAHVRVLLALEKEVGVTIDETSLDELTTVKGIAQFIESRMKTPEERIEFRSDDDIRLFGTIIDCGEVSKGTVLFVHGITADRDEWGLYSSIAASLAAQNVSSLRFDFRAHGQSIQVESHDMTLSGIYSDVDAALAAVVERGLLRASAPNLAVVGSSFGGGVAAKWALDDSHPVCGVILCAPVLSYQDDINRCCPNWREELESGGRFTYGPLRLGQALAEELKQFEVGDARASERPVVIVHGTDDSDVPIEASRKWVRDSPNASLVQISGADHGFTIPGDVDCEAPESLQIRERVASKIVDTLVGWFS